MDTQTIMWIPIVIPGNSRVTAEISQKRTRIGHETLVKPCVYEDQFNNSQWASPRHRGSRASTAPFMCGSLLHYYAGPIIVADFVYVCPRRGKMGIRTENSPGICHPVSSHSYSHLCEVK